MPRLYLIFIFLGACFTIHGQVKLKDLITFGDTQFAKGDYYYASQIYDQAIGIDSNAIELHWKQAETQKAYKNYELAAKWYAKVYAADRDQDKAYPNALLNYALMVKQTGRYTAALELFKKAYKESAQNPSEYTYLKAGQEIKSTQYALKSIEDSSLFPLPMPKGINSYDAEFGHLISDGVLYFSSLKADSINSSEEVYSKHYRTRIYKSFLNDSVLNEPIQWKELASKEWNTGNGSFDSEGWFYYSICNENKYNYRCKIVRAKDQNGTLIIDTLPENINALGSNVTNPVVVKLKNKKNILFFSSDCEGGKGGMDIWYSLIKTNGTFESPKNITSINSIDNEITPWYDVDSNKLYFSSTWHYGFGGYDVFSSKSSQKLSFSKPVNIGRPLNGPANDLYYFRYGDSLLFSSNRIGSLSKKNPTCCSDIYFAKTTRPPAPPDSIPSDSLKIKFPVTLYFRNDYPNPKSYAKKSNLPYHLLYQDYLLARKGYLDSTTTSDKLSEFFTQKVDLGFSVLLQLYDSVAHELERGNSILLFSRGYASPLNVTQYNVNLTQRRISSVQRFFLENQDQRIQNLLDRESSLNFKIIEVPLGEYAADQTTSDNLQDRAASVYSLAASIERKVEILYMARAQSLNSQRVDVEPLVQEQEIKEGTKVVNKVKLTHDLTELEINDVKFSQEDVDYEIKVLGPNTSELTFEFIPEFSGKHASCFADVYFESIVEPIRVYFTFLKK